MEDIMLGEDQAVTNETFGDQETSNASYGDKMRGACCGSVIGILLFLGMLGLAGWNEYRNVATSKTLAAARENFREGSCSPISGDREGNLVHMTCGITNLLPLGGNDPLLQGIPEEDRMGLYLNSYMEVYQWVETTTTQKKQKTGGGTVEITTYNYDRRWAANEPERNVSFFKQGQTCQQKNSGLPCLNWDPTNVEPWWSTSGYELGTAKIYMSPNVMAGAFVLPLAAVSSIGHPVELKPTCSADNNAYPMTTLSPKRSNETSSNGSSTIISSQDNTTSNSTSNVSSNSSTTNDGTQRALQYEDAPLSCAFGDTKPNLQGNKVTWTQRDSNGALMNYLSRAYTMYAAETISVLAQQKGNTFVEWSSPYDDDYSVFIFREGNYTVLELLDEAEASNTIMTWILRALSLILVIVGGGLFFKPLATMPDIIPCVGPMIGDLVGCVTWLMAGLCGCGFWSIVVGLCWLAYRPIIGISLLIVACLVTGGIGYVVYRSKEQKKNDAKAGVGKQENTCTAKIDGEEDIVISPELDPETGAINIRHQATI